MDAPWSAPPSLRHGLGTVITSSCRAAGKTRACIISISVAASSRGSGSATSRAGRSEKCRGIARGAITPEVVKLFLVGLPALLAGAWLGLKLFGLLDEAAIRKVVLVLLLASV